MSADKTRNVLVLTSTMPRWQDDTEPAFVEYLCLELAKTHKVRVLAPHCPGARRRETRSNGNQSIEVHRYRYFSTCWQSLAYDGGILANIRGNPLLFLLVPFFLAAQLFSAASLHRRYRFDVIHAHWIIPQGLIATALCKFLRNSPAVLVTSHGGDLFALHGTLLTRLKRWILNNAAWVTVVSEAMRSKCKDLGCDETRISVSSMGVDLATTFTPGNGFKARRGLIFVGRLVEKKGVQYLIRAMSILRETMPDLQLTIVGDGPDRQKLTHLTRELRLSDNIEFLGSIPNAGLPDHLRSAKIAVMPSVIARSGDQEGLGLVAVEAMGCGCAVVASDLPAVRDTVQHAETGLIAAPGDAKDLADKIDALLGDDQMCQALAKRGRRYALEKFDWKVVGRAYSDLVSEMGRK